MSYSEPANLAIVACPGGEVFAEKVIFHLCSIDKHRYTLYAGANLKPYKKPNFKVNAKFTYFMNGEFKTEIFETIRGKDVFIFQDVENHNPLPLNDGKNVLPLSVNDHILSLLVTADTVRQAGAANITLVLPVYPYSRQHKKKGREGLAASLLAHIFENMGVNRIITLDIHSREIENAFSKTHFENLHASYQIIRELGKLLSESDEMDDLVVVSPDTGAIDRNKFYATGLKKPLAMLYKERDYSVVSQDAKSSNIISVNLLGDVHGKVAFMADDMLGTGGTLLKAMEFLRTQGAKKVIAAVSLPFFTGNAIAQFEEAYKNGLFYRVIGTNAVYHKELENCEWYINTNVAGLFANVITRLHYNQSLSYLLDNRSIIEKMLKVAGQNAASVQASLFD